MNEGSERQELDGRSVPQQAMGEKEPLWTGRVRELQRQR